MLGIRKNIQKKPKVKYVIADCQGETENYYNGKHHSFAYVGVFMEFVGEKSEAKKYKSEKKAKQNVEHWNELIEKGYLRNARKLEVKKIIFNKGEVKK